MPVAEGTEVYNADAAPVIARGYVYTEAELETARVERLEAVLDDHEGRDYLAELYRGLELTEFGGEKVAEVLEAIPQEDHSRGWREGEALAEAWLVDNRQCEFPWPFNRDLRHYRASLPGAELVGFTGEPGEGDVCLAVGQVKTSKEQRFPPQCVNSGDKCLVNQLLQLRDDIHMKNTLLHYLAHRSQGAPWYPKFREAAQRFLNSGQTEIALFGVLIRDVDPRPTDLAGAAARLQSDCPAASRIELSGLYLPVGSIPEGPQHRPRQRRRAAT